MKSPITQGVLCPSLSDFAHTDFMAKEKKRKEKNPVLRAWLIQILGLGGIFFF